MQYIQHNMYKKMFLPENENPSQQLYHAIIRVTGVTGITDPKPFSTLLVSPLPSIVSQPSVSERITRRTAQRNFIHAQCFYRGLIVLRGPL